MKKVAIIGSGISGLACAHFLSDQPNSEVVLYEKNDYIGGHARTVDITVDGTDIAVDTGFIVFNQRNYPQLTKFFADLGVATIKSNMSFGVSIANTLEYGTYHRGGLFAQKRNILRAKFYRMLLDIIKFNNKAKHYIATNQQLTLGELLEQLKLGKWFRDYYILAMGASIWSTPLAKMLDFPAVTFIRFFDNHGLLNLKNRPQWYTVQGGSRQYINKLLARRKFQYHTNSPVNKITPTDAGVRVDFAQASSKVYDQVILATHSDQALALLARPTTSQQQVLAAIKYQPNHMVLHGDVSFMPKNRRAWSSWVYLTDHDGRVSLSYWMNNLQNLPTQKPVIITLNPARRPQNIYDEYQFSHPVFDTAAIQAQQLIKQIQGQDNIYFAGAWQRYGFHEDGFLSATTLFTN
jgi:predicted NAD/FAD-binding protein